MDTFSSDTSVTKRTAEWYEVPEDSIPSAVENLVEFWPKSFNIYNFIIENLKLSREFGKTKVQLYRNKQNGLLIATIKGGYRRASIYSSINDYSGIEVALRDERIINFSKGAVLFCAVKMDCYEVLENICPSLGKSIIHHYPGIFDLFWLRAEVAKSINVECPEDMYFSKLEEVHTDIVNSTWQYGSSETFEMVNDLIKFMDTVGLYTKKDSQLVAWVLNTNYGIGMLYTIEGHRKKGYGTLVLKKLAKILGQSGRNSTLVTLQENLAAKAVFSKIGFEFIEPVMYREIANN
ncbi:hypothetical protein J437_LFUL004331 [Ladona fulva]|uniref:N-acetyltransferase domain-containing protein n=1 Tax=Ladona fulva TaxID=123851 RepID=A0A8K0K5P7_LADFU|nr:hypothetical protein J437_LFUL004331 [Ladona fulva]